MFRGRIRSGMPITPPFQIQDTFEGLKYLHTRRPPICHGDLKSVSHMADRRIISLHLTLTNNFQLNILVSSSCRAIITDFGSARALHKSGDSATSKRSGREEKADHASDGDCPSIQVVATGNQLTLTGPSWSLRWAPPEVVNGSPPHLPSDIWSVGWVCWEVR